jgi:hypothetical protein
MDFYQGVVTDYLRADRAVFLNTECCIQVNPGENPDSSGPHWYCDAIAVDLRKSSVFLCEISYSTSLDALIKRLNDWNEHWPTVCAAIVRDCHMPPTWPVRPWLFVPAARIELLHAKLAQIAKNDGKELRLPEPLVTCLEDVVPWKYKSWNRYVESPPDSGSCS